MKFVAKIEHVNIMKYILWFKDDMGAIITISEYKEGKNLQEFVEDYYKENLN